jgi:hypothetical protein
MRKIPTGITECGSSSATGSARCITWITLVRTNIEVGITVTVACTSWRGYNVERSIYLASWRGIVMAFVNRWPITRQARLVASGTGPRVWIWPCASEACACSIGC